MIPTINLQQTYTSDETIEITAQLVDQSSLFFSLEPLEAEVYLFNQETARSVAFEVPLKRDGSILIKIQPNSLRQGSYKITVRCGKIRISDFLLVHRPNSK